VGWIATNLLAGLPTSLWAGLPTNLWANLPMTMRDGFCKENSEWGAGAARGGVKAAVATAPPPLTEICVTRTETGKYWHGKRNRVAL
jgi:hypothetical protein